MTQERSALDLERLPALLSEWLTNSAGERVDVVGVEQPEANGFSNITLMLDTRWIDHGEARAETMVARIEPIGEGLFPTYDVGGQYRVMTALSETSVPVPPVLAMEPSAEVLGVPFFVMRHVPGIVPSDDPSFAASGWILELTAEQRTRLCRNALAALVAIHDVDWRAQGLEWLARTTQGQTPAERELAYYESFYAWAAEGTRVPVIEAGIEWARQRMPAEPEQVLSWGDSRIGNMIFGEDLTVRAVIDWEGATIASREKDLGHWLQLTHVYTEQFGLALPAGFPDRAELLGIYEDLSGCRLGDVHFYEVLSGIHSSIQATRALSLMGRASGVRNEAAIVNNPFTRGLARLIDFDLPEGEGLDVLTGKR